jgi:uncharacterized phage protein (TIGR02220 family)
VWSTARETGKFEGEDLHLTHTTIEDLDQISGIPGLGKAMNEVGWVVEREDETGIFLPNFKEFNVPKSDAERAKDYREGKKSTVTDSSRKRHGSSRNVRDEKCDFVTPREEKIREEELNPLVSSLRSETVCESFEDLPPTNLTTSQESPARASVHKLKQVNGDHSVAIELLEFLNTKTGKNFRPVPANLKLIEARLASGVEPKRVRQVILRKWREWSGKPDMQNYLRPATLFAATNFEQYLGEIPADTGATIADFFPKETAQ